MKTNKLPKSAWPDSQAAGSQSQQTKSSQHYLDKNYLKKGYRKTDNTSQSSDASNDANYHNDSANDMPVDDVALKAPATDNEFVYKKIGQNAPKAAKSVLIDSSDHDQNNYNTSFKSTQDLQSRSFQDGGGYKKAPAYKKVQKTTDINTTDINIDAAVDISAKSLNGNTKSNKSITAEAVDADDGNEDMGLPTIPERIFMNGLIKHTGIALAIIIPLAAFSAYAATPPVNTAAKATVTANVTTDKTSTETLSIKPNAIIHKSASVPTTVDSVDLKKYAGTWYEIGRLPMYFQRNCASDVTATYVEKTDGSGIKVINQCKAQDGSAITAEGLAKPADASGSKLKVTFLPSWIRWVPVGRADYWVLARDADYKTALVGTPDKEYLWLLARSPNVSQETYAKYRQIAQKQGYDLKEFKLTPQTNQTVKLVP
ncbi:MULTISPECIES: lipocalin family protein [Psychrobacter]|uniref:Lipocalin family protein n=1 Tax=Psychrobacter communis TaxID=2762238 RepID=A0ABR8RFF4_9GAMM|nr:MULTISPECIES: lipocalin family protein [Psychrobacter]MBD7946516.1 lipocalin family protein [Psychrobacter communis]HCR86975.1 lipocalin [Psychrobacter sp.]